MITGEQAGALDTGDGGDPALDRVLGGSAAARKAHGVYYTPPQVVAYLVQRTLGPLLAEQLPDQPCPITILDPACGSGLFLVAAYKYLLAWYEAQPNLSKIQNPKSKIQNRLRILRTHIFGLDLDPQAVTVARRALLAVAGAGEGEPPLDEDALAANLRCGNALIGPDFAAMPGTGEIDPGQAGAFDWAAAFPAIMQSGGFAVVLGNPPYLSYSGRQAVAMPPAVRRYLRAAYTPTRWPSAQAYFVERAVRDLGRRLVALVVPDQVGHLAGYAGVRALVTRHSHLAEVRYWGEAVFPDAVTPVLTFVADRQHTGDTAIYAREGTRLAQVTRGGEPWRGGQTADLAARLRGQGESLGALVGDPGVHTGNCARRLIMPCGEAPPGVAPVLEGRQVRRYACAPPVKALRLDYQPAPGEYFTIRAAARYTAAPFVIRQTARYPIVGPRRHADYFRNSLLALYPPQDGRDVYYLVALLNSTLLRYLYRQLVQESQQEAFPQVKVSTLRQLPIRPIDFADPAAVARHDTLVTLVTRLLALHEPPVSSADAACQAEISAVDQQIDRLVYAVYGLTEAEIAVVEADQP